MNFHFESLKYEESEDEQFFSFHFQYNYIFWINFLSCSVNFIPHMKEIDLYLKIFNETLNLFINILIRFINFRQHDAFFRFSPWLLCFFILLKQVKISRSKSICNRNIFLNIRKVFIASNCERKLMFIWVLWVFFIYI